MAIWEIKRFLNKDKDLTLDDLLAAKVVCKGALGTSFEFTNKDGVYPKFILTLEADDEDSGEFKKKFVNIRPGSYSVKITNLSNSTTIDLDDVNIGTSKVLSYTLEKILAEYLSPGVQSFTVPDGINEIYVTAIAGGAPGGAGGISSNVNIGGDGGGGGGAGQSIIDQKFTVTPMQAIQITVGDAQQATIIGSLTTLSPGVAGTAAVEGKPKPGKGGSIGGEDGNTHSDKTAGDGGNGGPGINKDGTPVSPARGGNGGDNTGNPGANGTGYGSGGAGGEGADGNFVPKGGAGGSPTAGCCIIKSIIKVVA